MKHLLATLLLTASAPGFAADRTTGHAILFDADFSWNNLTTCLEPFNDNGLMVSHETLPCYTEVKITNLSNGESVIATVVEKDSSGNGALITITSAVARQLEATTSRIRIKIEVLP